MVKAENGQIMTVDEALALQDKNGEAIKWVKNDDGSYFSEITFKDSKKDMGDTDKKPAEYKYFYTLEVRPQVAQVSVVKQRTDRNIPKEIIMRSLGLPVEEADLYPHIGPVNVVPEKQTKSKAKTTKEEQDATVDAEQLKKEQDKKAGKWIDETEYSKLNKKPK